MKYHFKIHKAKKGYWAECLELKGCVTQADLMIELRASMKEALNLWLDEPDHNDFMPPFPQKRTLSKNVVAVDVDPRIALAITLRHLRHSKHLTQKQVAEALGMRNLYTYQRLESSKTANPELVTLSRLKAVFPELNLDDIVGSVR